MPVARAMVIQSAMDLPVLFSRLRSKLAIPSSGVVAMGYPLFVCRYPHSRNAWRAEGCLEDCRSGQAIRGGLERYSLQHREIRKVRKIILRYSTLLGFLG